MIPGTWWSAVTNSDKSIIASQLGRQPRGVIAIARRCRWGAPMVVVTSPVVWGAGRGSERKAGVAPGMPRVFPTMYWLTCPYLASQVSRLESDGEVGRAKEWLEKSGQANAMLKVHARAAQERLALAHTVDHHRLQQEYPAQWHVLASAGVGGTRARAGVKCLHMHLADYLAGPVGSERVANKDTNDSVLGKRNPVGARVMALLLKQGVDITGSPDCHQGMCGTLGCRGQRICAIDVGTNSCRMLLSEKQGSGLVRLNAAIEMPRLGTGLAATGCLSDTAINRTIAALHALLDQAGLTNGSNGQSAVQVVAVGTQALRSAINAEEFLLAAWEYLGLPVRVVSGNQEATYSFQGALAGLRQQHIPLALENVAVLDIGGGSTELVLGNSDGRVLRQVSVPIGAVRLAEQAKTEKWQLNELVKVAETILAPVFTNMDINVHYPFTLVGVGGTLTSVAAVHMQLTHYDAQVVTGLCVTWERLWQLAVKLQALKPVERKRQPGLQPQRADIIIPGMAIALAVLNILTVPELVICDSDILQGISEQFTF